MLLICITCVWVFECTVCVCTWEAELNYWNIKKRIWMRVRIYIYTLKTRCFNVHRGGQEPPQTVHETEIKIVIYFRILSVWYDTDGQWCNSNKTPNLLQVTFVLVRVFHFFSASYSFILNTFICKWNFYISIRCDWYACREAKRKLIDKNYSKNFIFIANKIFVIFLFIAVFSRLGCWCFNWNSISCKLVLFKLLCCDPNFW